MGKIKVYARVKPSKTENSQFKSTTDKILIDKKILSRDRKSTQNSHVQYLFDFDSVFDQTVTQTEMFQSLAIDALDRFLEGFNATIFAYGQTGSGKTYTMEGSARRFEDRGLIPRSISYIYDKLKDRENQDISVHISHFEIYNEVGFDLLNPASRLDSLMYAGLPKISIRERGDGQFVTHNLTCHLAADEQIAQHLLLQGSLSRKVASTTMNIHSSRSHAVFTIMLTSKVIDSDTITISKLNFVDLAGSERVAKTGAKGKVLSEAKFINKSLHHLEHVIIQLQKAARTENSPKKLTRSSTAPELNQPRVVWSPIKSPTKKKYISYRNSLLTMFLRDSLGGNCYTFMIATLSFEIEQMDESTSTCRFAQRVSCIKNIATRNEILDDKALIKKLKLHIRNLDREVLELNKLLEEKNNALGQPTILASHPLSDDEKEILYRLIRQFLKGEVFDPLEGGLDTREKILESLFFLKEIILQASKKKGRDIVNVNKPPLPFRSEKCFKEKEMEQRVESENIKEKKTVETQTPHFENETDTRKRTQIHFDNSHKQIHQNTPNKDSHSTEVGKELSLSAVLGRRAVSFTDRNITSGDSSIITPSVRFPIQKPNSLPVSPASQPSIPSSPNVAYFNQSFNKERESQKLVITPDALSKSNQYISPFEQKRRTHITNKIESLSKSEQSLQKERDFLLQNQIGIELQKNEDKLAFISSTIQSQKNRINQLYQKSSDPGEIENEIIAQRRLETKAKQLISKISELRASNNSTQPETTEISGYKTIPEVSSKNTGLILHNLADQERHQNKLKEGLEQIKILQFEQQLELKEAATRRKLLALKQQLKSTPSDAQSKSQSLPNSSHSIDRKLESNNGMVDPNNHTPFLEAKLLRYASNTVSISSPNQMRLNSDTPTLKSQEIQFIPQPPPKQKNTESVSKPISLLGKYSSDKLTNKTETIIESTYISNSKLVSSPVVKPQTKPELKPIVSQERVYMNAIQSNRSRVEKIRRVMSAAVVIQRYWRLYRKQTK